jgi:kumamolisin
MRMTDEELVALPGSHREAIPGTRRVADAPAEEAVQVTIVLRRRPDARLSAAAPPDASVQSRAEARRRLAEEAGADPADVERVIEFVRGAGMEVVSADAGRRTVVARGTVAAASAAFAVSLGRYEGDDLTYRGREGAVHVPPELADVVQAVMGLDDRPQARMHVKRGEPLHETELPEPGADPVSLLPTAGEIAPRAATPAPTSLWPRQVGALYRFPTDVDGSGEAVGIIELGGGYTDQELATYFARAQVPAPTVIAKPASKNVPGGDADVEVLLDIEVVGSIAPGATIVVYFGDNTDQGFFNTLANAVHDTDNPPSVISISWGGPEDSWSSQARQSFDDLLADAAALGVTVLAAAGDHGAGDAAGDGKVHADFPAASPHMIGCGGTTLIGANGDIVSEVTWNDADGWATGGGISAAFPVPAYQQGVDLPANLNETGTPGRGVPDVAGNADNRSGYIILADGKWSPVGGTSAVAPLYAGLAALLNQALGRPVGLLLPDLYAIPAAEAGQVFRDTTSGDNTVPASTFGPATRGYAARPGWDACTGLGSLNGAGLLAHLRGGVASAAAGAP